MINLINLQTMNILIESSLKTLEKAEIILNSINDVQLKDASMPPYFSSVGSHIRHILDFYDCIFKMNSANKIDLTARSRNKIVEQECAEAKTYLETLKNKLHTFNLDANTRVMVTDDLGLGKVEMLYTIGAVLSQANSHTIHHYAIINYILSALEITIVDLEFGYNPTSPKPKSFPY